MGTPFILVVILVCYMAMPNRFRLTVAATGSATALFLAFYLAPAVFELEPASFFVLAAAAVHGIGYAFLLGWNRLQRRDYLQCERLEQEVAAHTAAEARAERANEAKSRFLAVVSHELRTPLNGVLGGVQILDAPELPPSLREPLRVVEHCAHHLVALIDDLLDLSRIEAGHLTFSVTDFDLGELLDDVGALLEPAAAARHLTLRIERGADTPDWLRGDPVRLRQVLLNLGDNAIKFTERGGVTLGVRAGDGGLLFSVQDTGIGLAEADQARIFEPFAQVDDALGRRGSGAGLGLAISHRLVRGMGGRIELESAPSRGSRFSFELPLEPTEEPKPAGASRVSRRGLSLLLVEDVPANAYIAGALLEGLGHTVTTAKSGAEAIELAERLPFDVVLMDVHMPGMDGLEATRRIRSSGARAEVPILGLTADTQPETVQACRDVGMHSVLTKPLLRRRLERALAEVTPGRSATEATADALVDGDGLARMRRDLGDERLAKTITACLSSMDGAVVAMERSLASGDARALGEAAHRLKGLAATFGLGRLHRQTVRLEAAARAGAPVGEALVELSALCAQTADRLRDAASEPATP